MIGEQMRLETRLQLWTRTPGGVWAIQTDTHNLLTTAGRTRMARAWRQTPGGPFSPGSIAVGTGSTAPTVSDSALEAEVIRKTLDFGSLEIAHPVSTPTAVFETVIGSDEPSIQDPVGVLFAEAGLYSGEGTPVLISRALLPTPLLKTAGLEVLVRFSHTFKLDAG
ncbi:MAG: hypothetical protein IPH13_21630 [Planctomycetes bacterium]|nr:hypothetical protein [Planctomycetota bacterium]